MRNGLFDLMSRLGASPGFVSAEPGLAPKRLTLKLQIALNQQARKRGIVRPRLIPRLRIRVGFDMRLSLNGIVPAR